MPFVSNERLRGNYAENIVAEWLSRACLVRSVTSGTDIGIDLYCESVLENRPFQHFWVQVKAIQQKDITTKNNVEVAKYKFDTTHLRYWSRQPIPVYAFLVPINNWPPSNQERIYIIAITKEIILNGIPNKKYWTIKTRDTIELDSLDKDLSQFILDVIPVETSLLGYSKGVVYPIEQTETGQQHKFPDPTKDSVLFKYKDKVLDGIRDASILLGMAAIEEEKNNKTNRFIRDFSVDLAERFVLNWAMHEMGFAFLVKAALKDDDTDKATKIVNLAIAKIASNNSLDEKTKSIYTERARNLLKSK